MAKFNLIDEPWIAVISKDSGENSLLSLRDVFEQAPSLKQLAGDSKTQDFAVLRLLLAILQTVYSRMDASGQPYDQVDLTDRYQQMKDVDEFDEDDYVECLEETWQSIWEEGEFTEAVNNYLTAWHDRFYLFDDQYPFFQVTQADIGEDKISMSNGTSINAKNINRTISESNNKIALFSPKSGKNKDFLEANEIARWLLTFQGYTGLSDKVIFGKEKYKVSKGWLFDIGGLYLGGGNLFETLWLNTILVHPREEYRLNRQKPCWEFTGSENIDHYFSTDNCNNLAELYSNWSRAIYIDPETDLNKPFAFEVVKLPEIKHVDNFLEPMTVWRKNASGENKGRYTPRKHVVGQSLWRSFGLVLPSNSKKEEGEGESHRPEIINWLDYLDDMTDSLLDDYPLTIHAVSMQDNGKSTSWVPTD
ncbi:type I-E CRISPR-associated protein Cse1/CasA [Aerococcus sp. Group 2]|nr:type I-E CRISPR-associated protein Cse1/CasA [Aerococcus sp. Group 2]